MLPSEPLAPQKPRTLPAILGLDLKIRIVDVGANSIDGQPSYAPLLTAGHASVIGFEPNPFARARLDAQKGPDELYLPDVLGDGAPGLMKLCVAEGMTSLLEPDPKILALFADFPEWGRVVDRAVVNTRRLDDIPETVGVEFLTMDIQGAELMVLTHAIDRLRSALVVQTEVEFLPLYQGQPLFSDIDQFFRAQGFILHRFFPLISRALGPSVVGAEGILAGSQVVWADAVFVRDFTRPELMQPDQLLRLAVIVHDCFRSRDLALLLLQAHDLTVGTCFADTYLKRTAG